MRDKTVFKAEMIISLLVISFLAGMPSLEMAKANFYMPPANTVWTIEYPQNSTYNTNFFELRFRVETNLGLLYFYSLDDQPKREINTTTISSVPLPEYSPFIDGTLWNRRTHQGTVELPYVPKGMHHLAIYQIYPLSPAQPENGNIVSQALVIFNVTSEAPQSPIATANPSAASANPSTMPSKSPTPTTSQTPTLAPTSAPSTTPPTSPTSTSPKQQPTQTQESSSTSNLCHENLNLTSAAVILGAVIAVAGFLGLMVYFGKCKR